MKRALYAKPVYIMIVLASLLFNGCEVVENINLFTLEDEVTLGAQLDAQIRTNTTEYPIYSRNSSLKTNLDNRVFKEIVASPAVKLKNDFKYSLEIIDQDSVKNAFCTSGGFIYVYTGLIKYLDSESAVAGVIAHEIAHAEKRHSTKRMTLQYGTSLLLGLILGENPGALAEIATNLFSGLAFLANSRANEEESDEYAIEILKSTRFYAGSVKFFFEKMKDDGLVESKSSSIATFLSTHPDPIARISETNARLTSRGIAVKSYTSNDNDMFKSEYETYIRSKLK